MKEIEGYEIVENTGNGCDCVLCEFKDVKKCDYAKECSPWHFYRKLPAPALNREDTKRYFITDEEDWIITKCPNEDCGDISVGSLMCRDCSFFTSQGEDYGGEFVICKYAPSPIRPPHPTLPDPRTGWTKPMPKLGDTVLVEGVVISINDSCALIEFEVGDRAGVLPHEIHSIL